MWPWKAGVPVLLVNTSIGTLSTCSMSLSMSTLLNIVSQNSGMPLGCSSGLASSFFVSSMEAFSFSSSWSSSSRTQHIANQWPQSHKHSSLVRNTMSSSITLAYSAISSSYSGLTLWIACVKSVLICYPLFHVVISNSGKEKHQLALTASCSSSSLSLVHSHSSSVGSTVPVTISRLCNTHKTGTDAWKNNTFQVCGNRYVRNRHFSES